MRWRDDAHHADIFYDFMTITIPRDLLFVFFFLKTFPRGRYLLALLNRPRCIVGVASLLLDPFCIPYPSGQQTTKHWTRTLVFSLTAHAESCPIEIWSFQHHAEAINRTFRAGLYG